MTKQVQRRRGSSSEHTSFTGAAGEISVNTTNNTMHVHDGSTAGGFESARSDLDNVSTSDITSGISGGTVATLTITSADINGGTLDNVTIGGSTAAAGTFTNITASGTINLNGATVSDGGTVTTVDINGGTLDNVTIGGTTAGAGTFTNITATGTINLNGATVSDGGTVTTVDIDGGSIDGATIGANSAAAGTFSTATVTGDLTVDTNTLFVDSANNRVGVGTASPSTSGLHVETDTNPVARFSRGSNNTANVNLYYNTTLTGQLGGANAAFQISAVGASTPMQFFANGAERMRIDSSGNLLVGTTDDSPYNNSAGSSADNGFVVSGGRLWAARYSGTPLDLNRTSDDGNIINLRKDGSVVGSIKSYNGAFLQIESAGNQSGLLFGTTAYYPVKNGSLDNGNIDIGNGSNRFKGLYIGDDIAHLDAAGNARLLYDRSSNLLGNAGTNVTCATLSKSSGSFKIDHPLESKSDTHHLVHSFVEAPQADNIYRGTVNLVDGSAAINLDTEAGMTEGTFVALNREVQCFTSNESGWTAVKGSVSENTLTITAQDNTCTDTISWLVIGERKDAHMLNTDWTDDNGKVIVEPLKPVDNENMENA